MSSRLVQGFDRADGFVFFGILFDFAALFFSSLVVRCCIVPFFPPAPLDFWAVLPFLPLPFDPPSSFFYYFKSLMPKLSSFYPSFVLSVVF